MSTPTSLRRELAWPRPVARFAAFLQRELAAFPGRGNVMLRCVLGSAIVIVASMTLQVPELALSLMALFYVTQSNVVLTRMVAVGLVIGSTCAVAAAIVLYVLTFNYPLLRITVASAIFFCCVYMMRAVSKLGLVFFLVAIIVIYAQSFVDLTDNAEQLVRSCLWVWSAVNYPVVVALIINTVFLPAEPERQLRAAMHRQLAVVQARLTALIEPAAESPEAAAARARCRRSAARRGVVAKASALLHDAQALQRVYGRSDAGLRDRRIAAVRSGGPFACFGTPIQRGRDRGYPKRSRRSRGARRCDYRGWRHCRERPLRRAVAKRCRFPPSRRCGGPSRHSSTPPAPRCHTPTRRRLRRLRCCRRIPFPTRATPASHCARCCRY